MRWSRRRIAAGAVAALLAPLAAPGAARALTACTELGAGKGCRNNGQCCSHRCKKKHGKHKGTCRCSALGKPCFDDDDCCGHQDVDLTSPFCEFKTGRIVSVCCKLRNAACGSGADCCGSLICNESGQCVDPQ